MIYKDTQFARNLREVIRILRGDDVNATMRCMYGDVYTVKYEVKNEWNRIHIRKSPTFFNYWGYGIENQTIATLDYTVQYGHVKIHRLCIDESADDDLSHSESREMVSAFIDHVKTVAKETNKPKIVVALKNNSELFDEYYSNNGFVLSHTENPLFIEAELIL